MNAPGTVTDLSEIHQRHNSASVTRHGYHLHDKPTGKSLLATLVPLQFHYAFYRGATPLVSLLRTRLIVLHLRIFRLVNNSIVGCGPTPLSLNCERSVLVVVDGIAHRISIIYYPIVYITVRVIVPFPCIHVTHHDHRILSWRSQRFSPSSVEIARRPDGNSNEDERARAGCPGRSRAGFHSPLPRHRHGTVSEQITPRRRSNFGRNSTVYEKRRVVRFYKSEMDRVPRRDTSRRRSEEEEKEEEEGETEGEGTLWPVLCDRGGHTCIRRKGTSNWL